MNAFKIWLVFVTALILAACAPARMETIPNGAYTKEEIASAGTNIWTLTLKDGHFSREGTQTGQFDEGSYKVDGEKVTFAEESSSLRAKVYCKTLFNYAYTWTYDTKENRLTLKPDNDPCAVGGTWAFVQAGD